MEQLKLERVLPSPRYLERGGADAWAGLWGALLGQGRRPAYSMRCTSQRSGHTVAKMPDRGCQCQWCQQYQFNVMFVVSIGTIMQRMLVSVWLGKVLSFDCVHIIWLVTVAGPGGAATMEDALRMDTLAARCHDVMRTKLARAH